MSQIQMLVRELDQEAQTTRKMLKLVPSEQFHWQPHVKSMDLQRLSTHIAELPSWIDMILRTSELDFAKNAYQAKQVKNNSELLDYFEISLNQGRSQLSNAKEEQLLDAWTMRNGDEIYITASKAEVLRMAYCQTVHHRAQLGVYLRLLNIPIPGSYGPSADEPHF
jgi:uncharacterized damage-inducible protein DinB